MTNQTFNLGEKYGINCTQYVSSPYFGEVNFFVEIVIKWYYVMKHAPRNLKCQNLVNQFEMYVYIQLFINIPAS